MQLIYVVICCRFSTYFDYSVTKDAALEIIVVQAKEEENFATDVATTDVLTKTTHEDNYEDTDDKETEIEQQ